MKLHWSPKSPYVRKVMICAHELGLVPQARTACARSPPCSSPTRPSWRTTRLSKIPTLVREDGSTLVRFDRDLRVPERRWPAAPCSPPRARHAGRRCAGMRWATACSTPLILWRNEREREHPLHGVDGRLRTQDPWPRCKLLDAEAERTRRRAVLHRPRRRWAARWATSTTASRISRLAPVRTGAGEVATTCSPHGLRLSRRRRRRAERFPRLQAKHRPEKRALITQEALVFLYSSPPGIPDRLRRRCGIARRRRAIEGKNASATSLAPSLGIKYPWCCC